MTQGAPAIPARGGARRLQVVVTKFPKVQVLDDAAVDWDVTKVAAPGTLLTKYPKIDAAFFHNDDMALAAAKATQAKGRTKSKDRRR